MKKALGIFLIIIACVLSMATLMVSLPTILKSVVLLAKNPTPYNIGSFIGAMIFFLIFIGLVSLLLFFGIKLCKRKVNQIAASTEEEY